MKRIISYRILSWILIFLLFWGVNFGQERLNFYSITEDQGLPSNVVNVVMEDSRGFIWFGTRSGLSMYDGQSFRNFFYSNKDSSTIINHEIFALYEDDNNHIWIGTKDGLSKYNRKTNRFQNFYPEVAPPTGVNFFQVNAIAPSKPGELWLGTTGWGLIKFDKESHEFFQIPLKPFGKSWEENRKNNTINAICQDLENPGILWLATQDGLLSYHIVSGKKMSYSAENFFNYNNYTSLLHDNPNEIWVSGWSTGLKLFDIQNKTWETYIPFPELSRKFPGSRNIIHKITRQSDSTLWVGVNKAGLAIFDIPSSSFRFVKKDSEYRYSILSDNVKSVWKTSSNTIWVSHWDEGLSVLDPQ
ncbi:MAG: two-component regulator propeller domain-containing protein [Bacteroidota bacterium]